MNRDDIIRMAREAGLQAIYSACDEPNVRYAYENFDDEIERFANLITKYILAKSYPELVSLAAKHAAETVAAAEREACAYRAGIALLGADRGLAKRVDYAIRERGAP